MFFFQSWLTAANLISIILQWVLFFPLGSSPTYPEHCFAFVQLELPSAVRFCMITFCHPARLRPPRPPSWVTQVSLRFPLFIWMTSDSVDLPWTPLLGPRAPFCSSSGPRRNALRHLGWRRGSKRACHIASRPMPLTQHNESSSLSHHQKCNVHPCQRWTNRVGERVRDTENAPRASQRL